MVGQFAAPAERATACASSRADAPRCSAAGEGVEVLERTAEGQHVVDRHRRGPRRPANGIRSGLRRRCDRAIGSRSTPPEQFHESKPCAFKRAHSLHALVCVDVADETRDVQVRADAFATAQFVAHGEAAARCRACCERW
jgi:hypothetical protein